jgi:hypothetical protein
VNEMTYNYDYWTAQQQNLQYPTPPPPRPPRQRNPAKVIAFAAMALLAVIALVVLVVGLHKSESGTATSSSAPAALTTTAKPTTSIALPRPIATSWIGTWTYAGYTYPADLQLSNADPISGEIYIPGWCDATWSEVQRTSETSRLVRAHVILGNCHDNQWNVTVQLPNSITGSDTVHPTTTFEFTPQSS